MVGGRITSALSVAEIYVLGPTIRQQLYIPKTLNPPTEILANVQSAYVNHLPSVIWLRIRSSITLSIYQFQLTGRTLF